MATAIRTRYGGTPRPYHLTEVLHLTPEADVETAIRLGQILRLAQAISPTGRGLEATRLNLSEDRLTLSGPADLLAGETVGRRLNSAANAFGRMMDLVPTS